MSIVGNMAGCYSPLGKTVVIVDQEGNELMGVVTQQEQVFTATDNDVREGLTYASDDGVSTGTKVIPAYHTTETFRYIPDGDEFVIPMAGLDLYDYTKLQAVICSFNTSMSDSVSAEKVSILDKVYNVGSTIEIANVFKDSDNKQIDLGVTNNSGHPCVIRAFTYKEID